MSVHICLADSMVIDFAAKVHYYLHPGFMRENFAEERGKVLSGGGIVCFFQFRTPMGQILTFL